MELYDGQGVKTWQAQLDSSGAVREGKGNAQDCPFRYQGQYEDVETGLCYNRFRYYDPETGAVGCLCRDFTLEAHASTEANDDSLITYSAPNSS